MHRLVLPSYFAASILLYVVAHKLLNERRASANRNAEGPKPGAPGLSTLPIGSRFDVFLSFRGIDTRTNFTDLLYSSLRHAKIIVFKDDNELRQGDSISQDLLDAIKNSKILIPIISQNYGSSKWCLQELVYMMKCMKRWGHTVWPIFYRVDSADVQDTRGSFGEAFCYYCKRFVLEDVEKWKQALAEVGSLRGWKSEKVADGPEGELINSIVHEVLNELEKAELVNSDCQTGSSIPPIEEHYDVFLSFRGVDTRANFASHLYSDLLDTKIHVFMDDDELHQGDNIGSDLLEAIKNSKISIPIISENYASSKRCLQELVYIMECMKPMEHTVWPIFYKVDPAHVRLQTGNFGEAFHYYYQNSRFDQNVKEKWKQALAEVSYLRGWESEKVANGHDGELVKSIVREVLNELKKPVELVVSDYHTSSLIRSHYDVFLSFRGVDTRTTFVDYLYFGLLSAGIHVFKDDNELRVEESLSLDLREAIENSEILIPIISENYGSSKWCLDELVHMIECKNQLLPIFYRVEPAHVRHQTGNFGEAFRYYCQGRRFNQKVVEKWKQALAEVSFLKGLESEEAANGFEGESVKLIVQNVLNKLKTGAMLSNITENLVGIDSHVEKVIELVNKSSSATLCVGIHGCAGIGKTTLAKVIYNKLFILFEHHSIIAGIGESCNCKGIEYLQSRLISNILGKSKQVHNIHDGINFISSKFKEKKVLIFLDDVYTANQLEAFIGKPNSFAPGSKIIVTTKDESVLDSARVNIKYKLKKMDEKQSLILFSRHAFRRDSPPSEFYNLSRLVVSTIGGLPLDLAIVGSSLCGKTQAVWEKAVKKMQISTHQAVRDSLWMSYHALEEAQKHMFLDIACFLIGNDARVATYMWDACSFSPRVGIEVLRSLSLIKIGDNHEFIMHDHLRDLGREFVRKENYYEPHQRSRLWDYEEALEVLGSKKGTENIQAICLDGGSSTTIGDEDKSDDIIDQGSRVFTDEQFRNLPSLRFLHMSNVNITGNFNEIFSQLRWLKWGNCPRTFVAENFHVRELVILDLSGSSISDEWQGWSSMKSAKKLKVLDLAGCRSLKSTLFLSDFKNLEILILRNCEELENIESFMEELKTLVSVDLSGCSCLEKLPPQMGKLEQLKKLFLDQTMIEEIPSTIDSLQKLETLSVKDCKLLLKLPGSIGSLVNLQCLSLERCHQLRKIPNSIGELKLLTQLNLSGCLCLEVLPPQIGKLEQLKELLLNQTMIREIPSSIGSLQKLETLSAKDCKLLRRLPDSVHHMVNLSTLVLSGCVELAALPDSVGGLLNLRCLSLACCHRLREIPNSISGLKLLTQLDLSGCSCLEDLPPRMGKLEQLKELLLDQTMIQEIPPSIGSLKNLETLSANDCKLLRRLPDSIGHLVNLSTFFLSGCVELVALQESIGLLVNLQCLSLGRCHRLKKIPNSIGKLKLLTQLDLSGCSCLEELPPQMGELEQLKELLLDQTMIREIPSSIRSLKNLEKLSAKDCKLLRRLPYSIGHSVNL